MSVEEGVDIRILDPRKLDAEGRKAIGEMEKIRKRLEQEAKKADKAVDQIQGAPSDILNTQAGRTTTPGKIQPSTELIKGLAPIVKKTNPFKDLVAEVKANKAKQSKLDDKLDAVTDELGQVQGIVNNPIAFLFGKARGFIPTSLLKGGIIGAIVTAVATKVLDIVIGTFDDGGINDRRKAFLDEAQTIPELANLIAIRNGSIFFTSDVRVRQKVAQSSNTENLDVQSQRFNEFALGRDISG